MRLTGDPQGVELSTEGGNYRRIDLWFCWVLRCSQFSVAGILAQDLGEMFVIL